ncbi:MAG: tagaturonate reductase, partial [Clostridia bacterium]|nr:tagaturonate reductase [Clostridia bacterium]
MFAGKEKTIRPERVIQFGEGGFLRGFCDWMLQIINEETDWNGSVTVVQPIENGMCEMLEKQD